MHGNEHCCELASSDKWFVLLCESKSETALFLKPETISSFCIIKCENLFLFHHRFIKAIVGIWGIIFEVCIVLFSLNSLRTSYIYNPKTMNLFWNISKAHINNLFSFLALTPGTCNTFSYQQMEVISRLCYLISWYILYNKNIYNIQIKQCLNLWILEIHALGWIPITVIIAPQFSCF